MKSGDLSVIKSVYKFSSSHYDEHINSITNEITNGDLISDKMCDNINGDFECPSRMNGILEEFTKLYAEKLHRLDDVTGEEDLKKKVSVLESWVNDLGEQNSVLVTTVEELEKEASRRVFLLQEKLDKMAIVTRDSCVSLRDHQLQVTTLIKQKISAEDEAKSLQEKILNVGETNNSLLQENSHLRQDLHNILELMSRGRLTGRWDCSDFSFNLIQSDQLIMPEQSKVQGKVSPQGSEYSDNQVRHDSLTSNLSLDGDETSVSKLEEEIHNLKKMQSETNLILTQRDKHIAELQAQLTELYHRFSAAQAQVDNTTSTLQSLLDRGRQDSFEIFRRDEVIRQLLSPLRRYKAESASVDKEETRTNLDLEYHLSNNIDMLASRMIDLEEECQQLRHQNVALKSSHAHALHPQEKEDFIKLSDNVSSTCKRNYKDVSDKKTNFVSKQIQTDENFAPTSDFHDRDVGKSLSADLIRISKLENELSEKNILVRELQNHLVLSREELRLKDETLYNVEQKLDSCRRNYDEKEERMLYLTSQLTNLQLEVSRLHGNLQQLRMQLDNKSQLVLKLEFENRSLVRQLNEKSSVYEGIQRDFAHLIADIEKKKKEVAEQKLTIGTLQDALVAAKVNCDRLKTQFGSQYIKDSDYNQDRPKWCFQHRLHKGKYCSCRRAKSVHEQDENVKVLELRLVIDELSSYLKEAHLMALTVERERRVLEKDLSSCGKLQQESQRQKETLFRIRNESIALMSRLQNINEDLRKHKICEDILSGGENLKTFGPSNRISETRSKVFDQSIRAAASKACQKYSMQSEIENLRSQMSVLEHRLKKEKSEKEFLSQDANVLVSSVRQWIHFQKIANADLEERFQEQQKEINHLAQDNQFLVENFQKVEGFRDQNKSTTEVPQSSSAGTQEAYEKQDSLTNDTGIEESSILSSLSTSFQIGENFNSPTGADLNFPPLSQYTPVTV